MKKLLFAFISLTFLLVACNKESQQDSDLVSQESGISFAIQQTDFNFKDTDPVPLCNDELDMDYVVFTLGGIEYTSDIIMVDGQYLTQVVKLPDGVYSLTNFWVYSDNGSPNDIGDDVIVKAAPLPGTEYHDLMLFPLDIEVVVEPFIKKQIEVDVLCFEPLFYSDFGFAWFQFNDVRIEYQCVFGDICVDDFEAYAGSLYAQQDQGVQFDMPAIFEIHVYKGEEEDPLRVFSNASWFGEGACLEVYWPNRLSEDGEVFNFELWVLLATDNGLEYVLVDTWTFEDEIGAETGDDGVVDFVIGDCQIEEADYNYSQEDNTFTDPRDGQVYATVTIGDQVWMAENLNFEIANSWYYDNDPANGDIYGRLYTWDAAMMACPEGWHLPSDEEWKTLEMNLGMSQGEADATDWRGIDQGDQMKAMDGWVLLGNGSNSSGFTALPAGYRNMAMAYNNLGEIAIFWSSTENMGLFAWQRTLLFASPQVMRFYGIKASGQSVRCVKD